MLKINQNLNIYVFDKFITSFIVLLTTSSSSIASTFDLDVVVCVSFFLTIDEKEQENDEIKEIVSLDSIETKSLMTLLLNFKSEISEMRF